MTTAVDKAQCSTVDRMLGSLAITLGLDFDASHTIILGAVQELAMATQSLRPFVDASCATPTQVAQCAITEILHWRSTSSQLAPSLHSPPTSPARWSFDAGETSRDMFAQRECALQVLREFSADFLDASSSPSLAVHGAWSYLHWVPEGRTFVPMEIDVLAKDPQKVATAMVNALTEKFGAERCFTIAHGTSGCLRVQGNLHHIADVSPWPSGDGGDDGDGDTGGEKLESEDVCVDADDVVTARGWAPLEGVAVITLEAWRRRTQGMLKKPSCGFRKERDEARLAVLAQRDAIAKLREECFQSQKKCLQLEEQLVQKQRVLENADKMRADMQLKLEERDERIDELLCHSESLQADVHSFRTQVEVLEKVATCGEERDVGGENVKNAEGGGGGEDVEAKKKKKKKKSKKKSKKRNSQTVTNSSASSSSSHTKGGGGGAADAHEMEMLDAFIETAEWGRLATELEEKLAAEKKEREKEREDVRAQMDGEVKNQKDCTIFFDRALSLSLSIMFDTSKVCKGVYDTNETVVFKILDTVRSCFGTHACSNAECDAERAAIEGVANALDMLYSQLVVTQAVLLNMSEWCQLSIGGYFPISNRPKGFKEVQYQRGQDLVSEMDKSFQSKFAQLNRQRVDIARNILGLIAGIKAPFVFVADCDGTELKIPVSGYMTAVLDQTGMIAQERRDAEKQIAAGTYGKSGQTLDFPGAVG